MKSYGLKRRHSPWKFEVASLSVCSKSTAFGEMDFSGGVVIYAVVDLAPRPAFSDSLLTGLPGRI